MLINFNIKDFFEDLQGDLTKVNKFKFGNKIYFVEFELSKFRYDVLIEVGKFAVFKKVNCIKLKE